MAAGDHTRAWWPQMLNEIKKRWNSTLDWPACIELCREMTALREVIRDNAGVTPAKTKCKCCDGEAHIGPAPISVRSLLFALNKAGCIDLLELNELDRNWKRYQKLNQLDGYGSPKLASIHHLS